MTLLLIALALVAFLYASVGHAGASGYIAVLALAGMAASEIRPLALILNVLVAGLATWQFARAGYGRRDLFLWLALGSLPAALIGGAITLPTLVLKRVLAVVLLFSAWRLTLFTPPSTADLRQPSRAGALGTGAVLGWLAGLTGTGGGIFLTPWLILRRWLQPKDAAGVSAAFILVNSLAGLLGFVLWQRASPLPGVAEVWPMALVVIAAGALGAWCGSSRFEARWLRRVLAAVLLIASWKLLGLAS